MTVHIKYAKIILSFPFGGKNMGKSTNIVNHDEIRNACMHHNVGLNLPHTPKLNFEDESSVEIKLLSTHGVAGVRYYKSEFLTLEKHPRRGFVRVFEDYAEVDFI